MNNNSQGRDPMGQLNRRFFAAVLQGLAECRDKGRGKRAFGEQIAQ